MGVVGGIHQRVGPVRHRPGGSTIMVYRHFRSTLRIILYRILTQLDIHHRTISLLGITRPHLSSHMHITCLHLKPVLRKRSSTEGIQESRTTIIH
ncbi:hypothetical protein CASFOL_015055 [Castilleja foliolosa]|uniref:Uncharacterized protein n=1 Tax=Castilleja foliolosa TaxID=1961234 RepID=A0ABD3DEE9_9LAMI